MNRYIVLTVAIAVVAMLSLSKSFGFGAQHVIALENFLGGDKYLHFLCSFVLTILSIWATKVNKGTVVRLLGWPTVIVVLLMMFDESSQLLFKTRDFSIGDMMTNLFGAAIALCVATLMNYMLLKRTI
ncbi:VanZ family protein [Vibrio mangrovi]|uniref:VanZ family protein n=1 Tax=Vibrio mangrovi TaxID=474394 RepID=A0A1Y6IWX6_9VIBR|nr:VanZ family protein [Vibrio mangrovi]MDW6003088.1 VanZ family protein [Vibrio mangrovi]SMS01330.1 VanZ like family protein [Vibrio mangrovi]